MLKAINESATTFDFAYYDWNIPRSERINEFITGTTTLFANDTFDPIITDMINHFTSNLT